MLRWLAADLPFYLEQPTDPVEGILGRRRGGGDMDLVELTPGMGPAPHLDQARRVARQLRPVQILESDIGVRMQVTAALSGQALGMLGLAIRGIEIEGCRPLR